MENAGLAIAKLALAVKPFANCHWIFCGPGNNGGDGLEAATHLHAWGQRVKIVLWQPQLTRPADSEKALEKVRALNIHIQDHLPLPENISENDFFIDTLLGVGLRNQKTHEAISTNSQSLRIENWIAGLYTNLRRQKQALLAVDVPSGLNANTGQFQDETLQAMHIQATHTLQLLNAKPGCFTAHGRDACGTLWLEDLGTASLQESTPCTALLNHQALRQLLSMHASHKGSFGDVSIVGGEELHVRGMGMTGAVELAASAALHAGAGRVMATLPHSSAQPEIMARSFEALNLSAGVVVCGCGGGMAIQKVLSKVLEQSVQLVLDADALNAIAQDPWLQDLLKNRARVNRSTVLTPHPLEAARLLKSDTAQVQNDRLQTAHNLAQMFACTIVLKGSGTVIAQVGQTPVINPTGNARLATAGTGDVLAGIVGARWAQGLSAFDAACAGVFEHGQVADLFSGPTLTAGTLAQLIRGPQTAS